MRAERQELNPEHFIEAKIDEIKKIVGNERALVAVSGGVDSSTCAVLAHKALGEQIDLVFLDTGLMREGEPKEVQQIFQKIGLNLEVIDVQTPFFNALRGIARDKEKRKVIQDCFYLCLANEREKRAIYYLFQGTNRLDKKETDAGLKLQHNVGIDPERFGFIQIIEPLENLYKDEIRQVARALGMPKEITERMPFPGPGLAIRVMGEVTPKKVEWVRKATTIVERELGPYEPFQAFAVLLSDQTTGVINGERRDGHTIALRVVESKDGSSATVPYIPWDTVFKLPGLITSEIPEVNRVVYDLTSKPPATIEYQ